MVRNLQRLLAREWMMAFAADHEILLDRLDEELSAASGSESNLFSKIIASACNRIPILDKTGKTAGLARLIETGAWIDAALALIEFELPAWKLRRLVYENGEWLCSLSRQPSLPMTLDDCVDAVHETLALAILRAFVEARRRSSIADQAASVVPQRRPANESMICCDNFA
jgi:hypothetical protein